MNGEYEIDEKTFRDMPIDKQNWIMFKTFNSYRDTTDARLKKLESRKHINGILGGAGSAVLVFGLAALGKIAGLFK